MQYAYNRAVHTPASRFRRESPVPNCGFPLPKWTLGSDVVDGFGGGSAAPQKCNGKDHHQNQQPEQAKLNH